MSREALSEEQINAAFSDWKQGTNIQAIADKNYVSVSSLFRYFRRRKLRKSDSDKPVKTLYN